MDSVLPCNTFEMSEKISVRRSSISSIATEDSGYSSIFRTVNSVRVYNTKDEYLVAMIEDLAVWIQMNHFIEINVDNFFDCLESGVILCKQAQTVQNAGEKFIITRNNGDRKLPGRWSNCCLTLPGQSPRFQNRQTLQKFIARDNVANFIGWLRLFGFNESIMFETEDLISRKNIRHVVLALLELARVGGLYGLNVPNLIELEQEIDAEILSEVETATEAIVVDPDNNTAKRMTKPSNKLPQRKRSISSNKSDNNNILIAEPQVKQIITPKPYFPNCDIRSLDEMVREILLECECKTQFPMTRLSEGKYLFGERDLLIFVRILRRHVMVRVGGGWDTLNHLLYKHDQCRKDKSDGTLQMFTSGLPDQKGSSSDNTRQHVAIYSNKKLSKTKIISDTDISEIDELSSRLVNIPTSYSHIQISNSKVKRRSSLQLPHGLEMTLRARGSKIPVLCRNLKVIKEIPISSRQADSLAVSETTSAPCSRQHSPILVRRPIQRK